jgi:hypothetical protein
VNAFYELGIRHALRPRTTIVISEDKLTYPFDLNHIKITSYTHLGDAIDFEEVERFRNVLGETIDTVLKDEQPDSPVYTFLDSLVPPSLREQAAHTAEQINEVLKHTNELEKPAEMDDKSQTLSILTQQGEQALKRKDFITAKALFNSALLLGKNDTSHITGNNAYFVHRLVLATYKGEIPNPVTALNEALSLLVQLDLAHTNDPETVSLAGSIKKKLYENGEGDHHLSDAILFFERGYYLLNNRFNGINLAYLFNCRADSSLCKTREEQIADMVWANRTRLRILEICNNDWLEVNNWKDRAARKSVMSGDEELSRNQKDTENERRFWILVNKAESHFGLGETKAYEEARSAALKLEHEAWMFESFEQQVFKLSNLLDKHRHLLNPPPAQRVPKVAGSRR